MPTPHQPDSLEFIEEITMDLYQQIAQFEAEFGEQLEEEPDAELEAQLEEELEAEFEAEFKAELEAKLEALIVQNRLLTARTPEAMREREMRLTEREQAVDLHLRTTIWQQVAGGNYVH